MSVKISLINDTRQVVVSGAGSAQAQCFSPAMLVKRAGTAWSPARAVDCLAFIGADLHACLRWGLHQGRQWWSRVTLAEEWGRWHRTAISMTLFSSTACVHSCVGCQVAMCALFFRRGVIVFAGFPLVNRATLFDLFWMNQILRGGPRFKEKTAEKEYHQTTRLCFLFIAWHHLTSFLWLCGW